MYYNNIHILIYVAAAAIGIVVGNICNWYNYCIKNEKKIFFKNFFKRDAEFKNNIWLQIITVMFYIVLLYKYGIGRTLLSNLTIIKYFIITPMLLSAFVIDLKKQIIPNGLNLKLFQIGIVFAFIAGVLNTKIAIIAIDMFLGMIAGGGIFLLITVIGGIIAGKEAMGFGDVKFMCALGLLFGLANTIVITLMAFLVAAIVSIAIMVIKRSKETYIPFGPFIVTASFLVMFLPLSILLKVLICVFSLGTIRI